MFRAAKWRVERNKTKAEFKLQFQVTQVPQPGYDKLSISLISLETGKIVSNTGRASINNGTCQWADAIFVTTRLEQDAKTGNYHEKMYNLVVSTGSSRFGFLGETTINLADYVGAITPLSVSLPLKSRITGTILHVRIQRISEKNGCRDFEQEKDVLGREHHNMDNEAAADDPDESAIFSEATTNGHGSEGNSSTNSTARFSCDSHELPSTPVEVNGKYRGHTAADASSTSSSVSSYTAKQGMSVAHEIDWKNIGIQQDAVSFLSSLSQNAKPPKPGNNGHSLAHTRQSETKVSEQTHGWNSDCSMEINKENIYKENERLKAKLQASETTIEELQNDVSSLDRQAEELAMEMETLKRQLAKETKQGQEFAREISSLKVERDNMKLELEQLKGLGQGSEKLKAANKASNEMDNAKRIIEELEQEIDYEKQVNINLNLQLQKTQESNSELLLEVQDLEVLLEKKSKEIEEISSRSCDVSKSSEDNKGRQFEDIEMEWLQTLSSSEQKIREITNKIIHSNSGRSLQFLRGDMETLETAFQEAEKESRSLICNLKNEIDTRNKRIAELEYGMHNSSKTVHPVKTSEDNLEAQKQSVKNLTLALKEDARLDYNHPFKNNAICDIQALQDQILQLDEVQVELENMNRKLEEEIRMYKLDIADLESQLAMVDEEAQALTETNQHLEAKLETLEAENLELQNCLHASQEADKLAREQIGDLMEEMSLYSGKTESENGIRQSLDKQTYEVEGDHRNNGSTLLHLQEQNDQLLKRISELETQLNHDEEKSGSKETAKERGEEFRRMERKLASTLELEAKIIELSREVEDYKKARDYLVKEMDQLDHEFEALKQEHEKCSSKQLEEQLQEELQNLRDEHATSFSTISILESKVEQLQQEIDTKTTNFAADLDALLQSKREQEQRAKRAEEELRKTRWNNATTAERLQEEFKRLSQQMSSTFDANEKLATQALKEASEFRLQKTNLQESLRKAEEEIASMKKQYQDNLQELMNQLDLSKKESEALSSKLQNTLDEIEKQEKNELNYRSQIEELSLKLATLQTEVETLMNEKSELTQKAHEYEHLKAGLEDTKMALDATKIALDGSRAENTELEAALQESYQEKVKLDKDVRLLQKNLRNLEVELKEQKCCRDDQETIIASLESKLKEQTIQISVERDKACEVTQLRSQHSELKHKLSIKDLETEDLRKQISYLQGEIQQKATALAVVERKLKEEKSKVHAAGGPIRPASKVGPNSRNVKELSDLRNKVKLLEDEIMSKTKALEALRQGFDAKEKDLQIKIEQLEAELKSWKIQNSVLLEREKNHLSKLGSHENLQRELQHLETVNDQLQTMISRSKEPAEHEKATDRIVALETELANALDANNVYKKRLQSAMTKQKEEREAALKGIRDMTEIMDDAEALRRKNSMMEEELREMQERYSQISLKFAEVEGERQQLVMTIRNLRSAKKK